MSVEVVMPQMGESITEGTVSKWLKAVGDKIGKDEPILEISTDKVDAEVPSPGPGVLLEIRYQEGETVEVGTVVALIGEEGPQAAGSDQRSAVSNQHDSAKANEVVPAVGEQTHASDSVNSITSADSTILENTEAFENATEIVMPQMGESITEGTVSKWLKTVGDRVEKDEPLLEISTDKVDAEVPSPAGGTLLEIKVNEGETVEVGAVVALVGAKGAAIHGSAPKATAQLSPNAQKAAVESIAEATIADVPDIEAAKQKVNTTVSGGNGKSSGGNGQPSVEDLRRTKSSPLVRNIAKEHGIDISRIPGSGMSGRVTKNDIMSFIETGAALRPQDLLRAGAPVISSQSDLTSQTFAGQPPVSPVGDRVEKMSVMRRKIAEHMTLSKQTSAHVTSVYEIDMTNVARFREKNKVEFQSRYGTKLTYMPFIFQTVINAIRKFPIVNAQVSGENIVYKSDINLGMAVALDWGLIVPVIKNADSLSPSGLALAANDLADRARTKKLSPDEVANGTFTITNPGVFGGLFGTPIINQPQVAILCVGTIEKRPKIMTSPEGDDYIAIRQMAYFALTYDHRIVDGADAERFLAFMKEFLEAGQFNF